MPIPTLNHLKSDADFGFITNRVPPLLPPDAVWQAAILATWIDPESVLQWMDDVEDRAAVMVADWAAQKVAA